MRIEIQELPPPELSPNYSRHMHWGNIAASREAWRKTVYYSALAVRNKAMLNKEQWYFTRATVQWTFIYGVNRTRDADNLIAASKSAQDMLVAAGVLLADDTEHLSVPPPVVLVDKERTPLTIIEIKEVPNK